MFAFDRFFIVEQSFSRFKNSFKLNQCLCLRVLRCLLRRLRIWTIFQNIERVTRLIVEHLHNADASLTRRRRHAAFEILWQRSFVDYFIHWSIFRFQMHDVFQSRHFFLNQDLFYRKTEKRRRWRNFSSIKRLLSVDIEFFERCLLYIFEIYRLQNRFRASYVRNFIFLDYFDFALKRSNRMIVFTINTFFFVDWYFTLNHCAVRRKLNIDAYIDKFYRCDYIADN